MRPSSVGLTINRCSVPQRQGSVRTVDEERGGVDVGIVRQPGRVSIHPPSIGHIECRTSHYTGFVWDDDSLFQHNDLGVLEQFEAVVTLTHIAPIGVYTVMVTGVCSLTFINIIACVGGLAQFPVAMRTPAPVAAHHILTHVWVT